MSKTIDEIKEAKMIAEGKIESIISQFAHDNDVHNIEVEIETQQLFAIGTKNPIGIGVSAKIGVKI